MLKPAEHAVLARALLKEKRGLCGRCRMESKI